MELNPEKVTEIFLDCLLEELPEDISTVKIVDGITIKIGFKPEKLKEHEEAIVDFLNQLPSNFHEKEGGGYSFLGACNNRNEEMWTGEHKVMQELFCLGMAIGRVKYCMPREAWGALPGGMPYLVITEKKAENA
jgi:hypothetical protein